MINDQNIVRGRHLDSLAADAKRFTLEQNLALNQAVQAELEEINVGGSSFVLDTTPVNVEGGLWYQTGASGTNPVLMLNCGGESHVVGGEVVLGSISEAVDDGQLWYDVDDEGIPMVYVGYSGASYPVGVNAAYIANNSTILTGSPKFTGNPTFSGKASVTGQMFLPRQSDPTYYEANDYAVWIDTSTAAPRLAVRKGGVNYFFDATETVPAPVPEPEPTESEQTNPTMTRQGSD